MNTIRELVTACRGLTRDEVRTLVDKATAECCPQDGTPEQAMYQAIYDEAMRIDRSVAECNEPFRASMFAIGLHYGVKGMMEW